MSLGTPDHNMLALGYSQSPPLGGAGGLCIFDLTGDLSRAGPVGPQGGGDRGYEEAGHVQPAGGWERTCITHKARKVRGSTLSA